MTAELEVGRFSALTFIISAKNAGAIIALMLLTKASKQHFTSLHVERPYCGVVQSGKVNKVAEQWTEMGEIKNGIEPYFDFSLYFQSSFNGKPVWAINREHLQYMIDYIEADVREKPRAEYTVKKAQSDHLPTFMKLAKNRCGMIKILRKMQTI